MDRSGSKSPVADVPFLEATCGSVRGKLYVDDDETIKGYLGIPYAKPVKRFERAEPAEKWDELDCRKYGPKPPTGRFLNRVKNWLGRYADEKNCLTLNVFVPHWRSRSSGSVGRPVIVYLHDGAYQSGSSRDFDAKVVGRLLPLKDLIVVTVTYRVGIFGFFTTGDEKCKGNFTLWDQTLALQWVQNHIKSFGGNPDNVTVLGAGAGAASAELLALSPHSRDLFHKMILLGGSASSVMRTKLLQSVIYETYARSIGCPHDDAADAAKLLEFYQNVDFSKLTRSKIEKIGQYSDMMNAPNMDGDFFPKPLDQLRVEAPKKLAIIGVSETDGATYPMFEEDTDTPEEAFKRRIRSVFDSSEFTEKFSKDIQEMVFEKYRKTMTRLDDNYKKKLAEFNVDVKFNVGAIESARAAAYAGWKVYLFSLFVDKDYSPDLWDTVSERVYNQIEDDTEDVPNGRIWRYIANSAKNGDPNPPGMDLWKEFDLENPSSHFQVDSTKAEDKMVPVFHGDRWTFIDSFLSQSRSHREIFYGIH